MALRSGSGGSRALVLAAGALLALTVLHDLDHVRQGRSLPTALNAIGALGTLGAVGLLLWTLRRSDENVRRVAGAFGVTTALGLVIIHVLPHWSVISDPYGEAGVDWVSWVSLAAFIFGGVGLAIVAYRNKPRRQGTSPEGSAQAYAYPADQH